MFVDYFISSRNKSCTFTFLAQFKWFFGIYFELLLLFVQLNQYSFHKHRLRQKIEQKKTTICYTHALNWKLAKRVIECNSRGKHSNETLEIYLSHSLIIMYCSAMSTLIRYINYIQMRSKQNQINMIVKSE